MGAQYSGTTCADSTVLHHLSFFPDSPVLHDSDGIGISNPTTTLKCYKITDGGIFSAFSDTGCSTAISLVDASSAARTVTVSPSNGACTGSAPQSIMATGTPTTGYYSGTGEVKGYMMSSDTYSATCSSSSGTADSAFDCKPMLVYALILKQVLSILL